MVNISGQLMIIGLRLRDHCGGCHKILFTKSILWPIPVDARSKAWVCGRSVAGIVRSNPAGGVDVCLL